jgi:hypothetical protein
MALQVGSDDPTVLLEAGGVQQRESDQKSEGARPVIVARIKVDGARKLGRIKEGGKEERVYIVVRAARGAIPKTEALNLSRDSQVLRFSKELDDLTGFVDV